MNLGAIAGPIVAAVNPWLAGQYRQPSGAVTTASDGTRTPAYATAVSVQIQAQALTWGDLQQMTGVNVQGEKLALYVQGDWKGVARQDMRGGDLLTITDDGSKWLVIQVLENWQRTGGWVKVACVRQMP